MAYISSKRDLFQQFLIKVHCDGTVEGDYWVRLEQFEFRRSREKLLFVKTSEERYQEMLAKLPLPTLKHVPVRREKKKKKESA